MTDLYYLGTVRGFAYWAHRTADNGVVILDFGSPRIINGEYGTLIYDFSTIINIEQIMDAVKEYATGFWDGLGNDYESFLTIIVGTNSSGYYVTTGHGIAWANMIDDLNVWVNSNNYNSQIAIRGGIDIEPGYGYPQDAIDWVDGYSSAGSYAFYNFGSADDCPVDYPPTEPQYQYDINPGNCLITPNWTWTQQHIFHVSWDSPRAWPFPEIYRNDEKNARQWYRIALYSYFHYKTMDFLGTLTTFEACKRDGFPPECNEIDNTPEEGHRQLLFYLGNDPYNRAIEPLNWITDIMWYVGIPSRSTLVANKKQYFVYLVLGILIVLPIFLLPSIKKVIAEHSIDAKPTKQPIDPYIDIIEGFQTELQRTDLPMDARELIESKLGVISLEATQRAEGRANQPTRPSNPNYTPQNIIGFSIPDGIDNTPEAPFSQVLFTPLNSWRKTEPDHFYLIFAGQLTEDIQQGALYILQPNIHTFRLYITPIRNGAVRVVAENGIIITLQSTDNTLFYFDAATEQFVNAQGTPFPATPTAVNSSPTTPIPYP